MRRSLLFASMVAALLGAFLLLRPALFETRSPSSASAPGDPVRAPGVSPAPPPAGDRAREPTAAAAEPASVPADPVDPDRRALAQPDGPGARSAMADTIAYPQIEKLTGRRLSAIPYDVVGAWDDAPDSPALGSRRAFVLVVDPELSDGELANLARDVRASHLDAEWLTLRIFDDAAAATRPSWTDGGASKSIHLVAELRRNTAGQGERLTVRGRPADL